MKLYARDNQFKNNSEEQETMGLTEIGIVYEDRKTIMSFNNCVENSKINRFQIRIAIILKRRNFIIVQRPLISTGIIETYAR